MPLQDEPVVYKIDSFLINNIDNDQEDRFHALAAAIEGDDERCAEITQRAMHRWSEYQKIIDPLMTRFPEPVIYPQPDLNNQINDVMNWIELHVDDKNTRANSRNLFAVWATVHNQQQKALIIEALGI